MKIKILFLFFFSLSQLLYSQTYKSGTISSPESWSGTVYISGNVTVTSSVTIDAGTKVLFKGNRTIKLIVDGAGSITANGTSGSHIYFSADDDEDGVYGEENERGLKFQFYPTSGSTGTSSFDYCIIEYIDCSNETGGNAYGALDIYRRSVNISNSILRNNKSDYGGAVFIRGAVTNFTLSSSTLENNSSDFWGGALYFGGSSGTVDKCVIKNNSASSGGGIYVYTGNTTIQNSLIYSNSVTSSGSGIYLDQAYSSLKIINTTCANNTNSGTSKDFQFSGLSGQLPKVVNSIIWGSNIGSLSTSLITVVNSAIQDFTNAGDHTSCISLSANNSDSNGPNFNAIDGSDWSVKYISPCRDAGVNSYTGVTIPSTDFNGDPKISTKDIGTYEVQYSRWTGTTNTDWATATNWEQSVDPSSGTGDVVIPTGLTNYPTGSTTQDFTIGTDNMMIVEPGAKVTLNELTNDGSLKLESDASGISSFIINSYTGNDADLQLYLTGGMGDPGYRWHYISSPFTYFDIDYEDETDVITSNTSNLAQWVDSEAQEGLLIGWIAYDGYVYRTSDPEEYLSIYIDELEPGKGYNHYFGSEHTYTLQGELNTGDVEVTLDCEDPDYPSTYGFNLLGNPFSSGLDWDEITFGTYAGDYPLNTSKVLHYTHEGDHYYYINGVGVPDNDAVTGIIPPMQGFFTKTYEQGNSITLPAGARTHESIPARYKGHKGSIEIPIVRIKLESSGLSDNAVIRFDESAKSGLDYDFDAVKSYIPSGTPYLYTLNEGIKYVINGQPFPVDDNILTIPVVVNLTQSGNHSISATQIHGMESYNVLLKDNLTGTTINLSNNPQLTFSSSSGLISDRFILNINSIATSVENPLPPTSTFNIYQTYDNINIQTLADEWDGLAGSIRIYDFSGKTVLEKHNSEFHKNSLLRIQSPSVKGLYLVEIKSGVKRYVSKLVIN